ncbi:MAG: (2Fe-2S) ferredoxin domain-containing protein [Deltaproteobacteria bacterium]|nr:(2Fe-2S) ferredoxin domain-containing protein [Deltaproteobacteria bacterium]
MADISKTPFKVQGFVCTNDRHGESKSCADGDSNELRSLLKKRLKENHLWGGAARVSTSGCLGLCSQGPNIVLFPEGKLFSHVTLADADLIMSEIKKKAHS